MKGIHHIIVSNGNQNKFYYLYPPNKLPFSFIGGILAGILEMTNGCKIISTEAISMQIIIPIIAFFLTFGGLSILSQCYSFIYDLKINFLYFVKYKILFVALNF